MIAWLSLGLGAALAASPWTLEDPEAWSVEERAALDRLAARAPELRHSVTLRRAPAPALGEDLTQPHTLVEPGRRAWTVRVEGLEDRVRGYLVNEPNNTQGLALALLERQLAHALAHALDAEQGWSRDARWRALSGWGRRGAPAESDVLSYASVHGLASPEEDLATVLERQLSAVELPGDPALHPRCRLRSKWRWTAERLGLPLDTEGCASLAEVGLDPERVRSIELLYAAASSRHPASLGGHLMLAIVLDTDEGERVDVYQLGALTEGLSDASPLYILRGLSGGFPSIVLRSGLPVMLAHYEAEDRAIHRLRLELDPTQTLRLLERLDETRQGWDRPYLFFTRNCMHYPEELVEAALGRSLGLPAVHGPDVFLGALAREGLLQPLPRQDLRQIPPSERAQLARALRRERLRALRALAPEQDEALRDLRRDLDAARPARRSRGYAALAALAPALIESHTDAAPLLLELLALSEAIERAQSPQDPLLGPLWSANAAVLALAERAPPDPLLAALPQLDSATSIPPDRAHSPMGRLTLSAEARGTPDTISSPGARLSWSWYSFRLGEPRAFASPPGLALQLLPMSVGFSVLDTGPAPSATLRLGALHRVWGEAPAGNPGAYLQLLDLRLPAGEALALSPVEAGLSLELAQWDAHRHHLLLSAGLRSELLPERALQGQLRLRGQLGARHPLTWLALGAGLEASPWSTGPMIPYGELQGQLHLIALPWADTALSGSAQLEGPDPHVQGALGLCVERR
ncbi:MAG: DUF4105 domain-containing protein [Alphaproteobacteria bacterium]|nr:DUF4105 domain-containing protein [Alphaproteobacteria bacterium]MCB9794242.1 DUF4105 domain-containing protein [Alphaproteobacteria bacterium]